MVVIVSHLRSTQINPRPVQMIKDALWMEGWNGMGGISYVVGSLRAPSVPINTSMDNETFLKQDSTIIKCVVEAGNDRGIIIIDSF